MKDRIRKIMESQHMTQQVFASFIGVSAGTLSSIFTGRTNPTLNIVESIKSKIPSISSDWLLFGNGQMYMDNVETDDAKSSSANVEGMQMSLDFNQSASPLSNDSLMRQNRQGVSPTPNIYGQNGIKITDKPERKITEIRIFYDDQTWETFVPKK